MSQAQTKRKAPLEEDKSEESAKLQIYNLSDISSDDDSLHLANLDLNIVSRVYGVDKSLEDYIGRKVGDYIVYKTRRFSAEDWVTFLRTKCCYLGIFEGQDMNEDEFDRMKVYTAINNLPAGFWASMTEDGSELRKILNENDAVYALDVDGAEHAAFFRDFVIRDEEQQDNFSTLTWLASLGHANIVFPYKQVYTKDINGLKKTLLERLVLRL